MRDEFRLVLVVGNDLCELFLDVGRILRLTPDSREGSGGRVHPSSLDKVPRRFGQEEETDGEDQSVEASAVHAATLDEGGRKELTYAQRNWMAMGIR